MIGAVAGVPFEFIDDLERAGAEIERDVLATLAAIEITAAGVRRAIHQRGDRATGQADVRRDGDRGLAIPAAAGIGVVRGGARQRGTLSDLELDLLNPWARRRRSTRLHHPIDDVGVGVRKRDRLCGGSAEGNTGDQVGPGETVPGFNLPGAVRRRVLLQPAEFVDALAETGRTEIEPDFPSGVRVREADRIRRRIAARAIDQVVRRP